MSNKSPYEVRLDVLAMAQNMLDKEHDNKMQLFNEKLITYREANIGIIPTILEQAPKYHTEKDVLSRASTLYEFVKDSTRTN